MKDENKKLREVLAYVLLLQTVGPYMGAARCADMARKLAPGINVKSIYTLMQEQEKGSIGYCVEIPVRNMVDSIARRSVWCAPRNVDSVSNL